MVAKAAISHPQPWCAFGARVVETRTRARTSPTCPFTHSVRLHTRCTGTLTAAATPSNAAQWSDLATRRAIVWECEEPTHLTLVKLIGETQASTMSPPMDSFADGNRRLGSYYPTPPLGQHDSRKMLPPQMAQGHKFTHQDPMVRTHLPPPPESRMRIDHAVSTCTP
jgi:hypothetical protein